MVKTKNKKKSKKLLVEGAVEMDGTLMPLPLINTIGSKTTNKKTQPMENINGRKERKKMAQVSKGFEEATKNTRNKNKQWAELRKHQHGYCNCSSRNAARKIELVEEQLRNGVWNGARLSNRFDEAIFSISELL